MKLFMMTMITVVALVSNAGAVSVATNDPNECKDKSSCNDCAGLAWCGWDGFNNRCVDTSDFSSGSTYIESTTACQCVAGSGKGCGPCTDIAVFCGYCPGSGGYNQCTEDSDINKKNCPSFQDTFGCDTMK